MGRGTPRIGGGDRRARPMPRSALATAAAATIVALVAACTPPAPAGPYLVPPAACTDVVLITARGSSQVVASDETASVQRNFQRALTDAAPGRTLRILELGDLDGDAVLDPGGYPALGFEDIPGLDLRSTGPDDIAIIGGYNESRRVGAAELAAVLAQIVERCPTSRLVLVGHSMGADAMAVGLRLVPPATLDRIDTIHFFGDPRFSKGPWARAPRVQVPSGHGLLGKRTPYVPAGVAGRTASWCAEYDGTCTGIVALSIFQLIEDCSELRQFLWCSRRHVDYDYWAHEPAMTEAAQAVIDRAGWSPAPGQSG